MVSLIVSRILRQSLFGSIRRSLYRRLCRRLPKRDLSWSQLLASTPVPANSVPGNKTVVELGDVVRVTKEVGSPTIFRRDGRFTDMVLAELAGAYEAPIYGILDVDKLVAAHDWARSADRRIR